MPVVTGWANIYTADTPAPTGYPYLSPVILTQASISNWCVQYVSSTTSSSWPYTAPWQIVRAPVWSTWTPTQEDDWTPAAPAVLEAHQRALERQLAEIEQREREREERRQAAAARARALLIGELDPVQREQFETVGHFIHIGRRGRRYRIRKGISANIDVLRKSDAMVTMRLCVHPEGAHRMPDEDVMLAQLLHLRDDERGLLRIANHHPPIAA
jgi:hypothetical protein